MAGEITGPHTDPKALDQLRPLWEQLRDHHDVVASYRHLARDPAAAWRSRVGWYERTLADGGAYFVARSRGHVAGYAVVAVEPGPDDTFDVDQGIAEIISLVVDDEVRGEGLGASLVAAAKDFAIAAGLDTLRVAVMAGNADAERFYVDHDFEVAEHVLYRRLRS